MGQVRSQAPQARRSDRRAAPHAALIRLATFSPKPYVTKAQGQFQNEGKPGWFFVAAAHEFAESDATGSVIDLYDGPAELKRVGDEQTVVLPQVLGRTDVRAVFLEGAGTDNVLFTVRRVHDNTPSGKCTIGLDAIDFHPDFPADTDGDTNSAYTTTDNYSPTFAVLHGGGSNAGYQFPTTLNVTALGGGTQVAGISPEVNHGGKPYFAGRTVIFTTARVVNRGSRVEITVSGSFTAGDVITTTVDCTAVTYTVQSGDDARAVSRGMANAIRGNGGLNARFFVRRHNGNILRIESTTGGSGDDGKTISVTSTGGGSFSPSPATLANGGADNGDVGATIAHEFGHAFGFPHKCGYHTWETSDEFSCCLNYFHTWIYADPDHPENGVQRFNPGKPKSLNFCGKHLDGVRKVHLEKNPALWKWK